MTVNGKSWLLTLVAGERNSNCRRQIICAVCCICQTLKPVLLSALFWGGMPHEFVLPHNFLQPVVAKDQDFLHPMEQFPKMVGHAVANSDAVQWVLESETKEITLGKVEIGQALNSLIQES